jgi:hypothetical protein
MLKVISALFFSFTYILIYGCSEDPNEIYHRENIVKHCYAEGDDIKRYVVALDASDIQFKYIKEEKCVYTDSIYQNKLERIAVDLFGNPPPAGLSMSWGKDKNAGNIALLSENNIETTIYLHHGEEYVSWKLKDAEKVEELLKLNSWQREMLKKFREEVGNNAMNGG